MTPCGAARGRGQWRDGEKLWFSMRRAVAARIQAGFAQALAFAIFPSVARLHYTGFILTGPDAL
jgi:hypothetical protein